MAANDYYYGHDNSHNDDFHRNRREDAPLPPLPATGLPSKPRPHEQHPHDISPVESPFDDSTYAYTGHDNYHQTPYDPTAPAASSNYSYNDPFADKNAIPLQAQKPGMNPMGVELENGGVPPQQFGSRNGRPPDGRRGWFKRPISWAVFVLSLVQLVVMIVEFIRNGMRNHKHSSDFYRLLTSPSFPNGLSHRDPSFLQPHDRPFAIRLDKHGRPLRPLHANINC
jgi:hypothetical protein